MGLPEMGFQRAKSLDAGDGGPRPPVLRQSYEGILKILQLVEMGSLCRERV